MAELEKVIKGLECCKTQNCAECPYEDTSAPVGKFGADELVACQPVLYADAIDLLKAQEQEISRLKHHVDCNAAEKLPSGCVGYGRGFNDDEPCETCKKCEKYNGYGEE